MNEISTDKKIKIFWYSDFLCKTGFGNVAQAIVSRLLKTGKYEFDILGINHVGVPYNSSDSPFYEFKDIPIWPASASPDPSESIYGYKKLVNLLTIREYDIVFIMQDAFNLCPVERLFEDLRKIKNFKYILYFPVDGDFNPEWYTKAVQVADYPVTYTLYGKKEVNKIDTVSDLKVIYHGVDTKVFKPFESDLVRKNFRKNYFKVDDDCFIISNINRNQFRKDLVGSILSFVKFYEKYPDSNAILYLHCNSKDTAGYDLEHIKNTYIPCHLRSKIIYPDLKLMGRHGLPENVLSGIYASSDLLISTSLGEGWGLSTTEAMACKTPVLVPNNTAFTEIVGENEERGYLVDSGEDDNKVWFLYDNNQIRPRVNYNQMADKIKYVLDNKEEVKSKTEVAYDWVKKYDWDNIVIEWDNLFSVVYKEKLNNLNRNIDISRVVKIVDHKDLYGYLIRNNG